MSGGDRGPWARRPPTAADRRAFADASTTPFWLDSPRRPAARPALDGAVECDLAIVGAGLSGLWAARLATERDPQSDVIVLEAGELGAAASGRNGGFLSSFLTHGAANGMARFAAEMPVLERLGRENFEAIGATVAELGIDCELELTGELDVAVEPHQVEWLDEEARTLRGLGHEVELLDREAVRAEVNSPVYEGGNVAPVRRRPRQPGEALLGAGRRGRARRGADLRADPGALAPPGRRRGAAGDRRRCGAARARSCSRPAPTPG